MRKQAYLTPMLRDIFKRIGLFLNLILLLFLNLIAIEFKQDPQMRKPGQI